VTGINSQHKLTAIKSKILETSCDIICLQEIKNDFFIKTSLRSFIHHLLTILNSSL
jgi:exonuclease III